MQKKTILNLGIWVTLFALGINERVNGGDLSSRTNPKVLTKSNPLSPQKDLGQIFRDYGSDKDFNSYTSIYHTLFDHLKEKPITILEIGIGTMIPNVHSSMVGFAGPNYKPGGSLRAWRDYFTQGIIHGIDIQPDTQFSNEPRIFTHLCDSTNETSVKQLMNKLENIKFDIIIDDGSHLDVDQLKTLFNFYPYLKENGYYIIEDICPNNRISIQPNIVAKFCNGNPYFFVGIKNNVCVIYNKHLERDSANYAY